MVYREGTEEPYFYDTDLFIRILIKVSYSFICSLGPAGHENYHPFCVVRSNIVEQVVRSAGDFSKAVHGVLHYARAFFVVWVDRFPGLKEDVGILSRSSDYR